MSKKQDAIRDEQSRDEHTESGQRGSAAEQAEEQLRKDGHYVNPQGEQEPPQGKRSNDHNKVGESTPTQKNEGRRTPDSRHDAEAHIGSGNQNRSRQQGSPGGGKGGPGGH